MGTISGLNSVTVTSNYTCGRDDSLVRASAAGGNVVVTLPPASAVGLQIIVQKTDSSTNTVTIAAGAGDTIDGGSVVLYHHRSTMLADGTTTWVVISDHSRAETGYASGGCELDSSFLVPVARLGSGTADSSKFLRGDRTWAAPSTSATNIKQVEIDFGSTPVSESSFTVVDSDVSATSQILAQMSCEAPTGKDIDEIEMDDLQIRCRPASGQFDMFIRAADGSYLADAFKINYLIDAVSKAARTSDYDTAGVYRGKKKTYRATSEAFVAAATADVPFFLIEGSSSKTITVSRVTVSGMSLTAVAYLVVQLAKYSTAASGGTSTTAAQVPLDSNDAAATSNGVRIYTAAPTAGTLVGAIASRRTLAQATTAAAAGTTEQILFDFSDMNETGGVVLRGTAQALALIWPVAPASAVTLTVDVEWTEE